MEGDGRGGRGCVWFKKYDLQVRTTGRKEGRDSWLEEGNETKRKETKGNENETKGGNSSVLNRHTLLSPSNIMQVVSKRTPQKGGKKRFSRRRIEGIVGVS